MVDNPLVVSISSGTSLNPDEVARRTFPALRKGVDGDAVRRYLESIADEIRGLLDREAQLRRRVVEAERKAAEPPVLDEATLANAVGAETARILQAAHDAAREVLARAEAQAGELVAEAEALASERGVAVQEEAAAVLEVAAEEAAVLASAALVEATALQEAAQAEVAALVEAAQEDAVALISTTRQRCREALREAKQRRESVLSDLVERRRALFVQLEQLRSGRDSLVEVVDAVGGAVEELQERLAGAEHDARVAAAEAGDRAELHVDDEVDTLLDPEIAMDLREVLLGDDLGTAPDGEIGAVLDAAFDSAVSDAIEEGMETQVGEQEDIAASHRSVGELFARIRASREAEESTGNAGGEVSPDTEELETLSELRSAEEESSQASPEPASAEISAAGDSDGDGAAGAAEANAAGAAADASEAGREGAAPDPAEIEIAGDAEAEPPSDAAALSKRDVLLKPVVTGLSRALKRALQDDQNELLNAIRQASGPPDLDKLLPEDLQRERYAQAASRPLADGWRVGRSWLRTEASDGAEDDPAVGTQATETGRVLGSELAAELAGLLRHRLGESLRALGDVDDGAQDAAGAAYREWKGDRVEGIAGDFATRAFAGGAVAAAKGTIVRWVVDDGRPCPDCDDNALAGEQLAGDEWPTGQLHPPVHPGCRCLLVAISD
jgi:hypothetical protein